jgi:hypothetical protein
MFLCYWFCFSRLEKKKKAVGGIGVTPACPQIGAARARPLLLPSHTHIALAQPPLFFYF